MSENKYKGTGVALVTPITKNKTVDFPALEKLVEFVIAGGVDYLVALGTTGEPTTLSEAEKMDVLLNILEKNNKRVPVICGLGGNNTKEIIKQLDHYPMDKLDGILSVSPYYTKPSQAGIIAHYEEISKHCSLPILLYNVPGRTGSNIAPETVFHLANTCKNIIGVKEASGNISQCMELVKKRPTHFALLSGDDNLALTQIACGFDGVISVAANCFPSLFSKMIQACLKHAFTQAQKIHYQLLDGIDLLFKEGNPSGVKCFLYEMGMMENEFRLPIVPVSGATQEEIRLFLKTL